MANPLVALIARAGNGRRRTDLVPPKPPLPESLIATADILGQEPKKRRKLGDIGKAIETAWQEKAQRVRQYHQVRGDGQLGLRNSDLPVRPTIRVTDAFGRPYREVYLRFKAVGGGTIGGQQSMTAKTNDKGEATGGVWRLGQGPGANSLEVRVDGRLVASFHAVAY
jgi:hypothetical protein